MIELQGVGKIFNAGKSNEFKALSDVDLSIDGKGLSVFTGPSGSGKTTLLSIIGCMVRPSTGRVFVNAKEITSLPERFAARIRREVFGFVFQDYHLIHGLSVIDNVMLPAYPAGPDFKELRERARMLIHRVDLTDKENEKVQYLSGGQRQRTAIARALINDPEVIIADEPTAHLDTHLAGKFLEIMTGLKAEGKTILIGSHDPLIFNSPGVDRIIEMRDGKVVRPGETP